MKICASKIIFFCWVKHSFVKVFKTDCFFMFNVEDTGEMACTLVGFDRSLSEKLGRVVQRTSGQAVRFNFCD